MNNNYQNELTAIIQQAQRNIIIKAMDTILERNNQMLNLLKGGHGIFEQATGDRFNMIYEQRQKIWLKIAENRKSLNMLRDIAYSECLKC